MSIFEVTVTGTERMADDEIVPVELIFFAYGNSDDEAMVSITTGLRVRCLESVTNVTTERM